MGLTGMAVRAGIPGLEIDTTDAVGVGLVGEKTPAEPAFDPQADVAATTATNPMIGPRIPFARCRTLRPPSGTVGPVSH
jgi:hypothetical protein